MSPSNNLWSWNERSIGWSLMGDPNAEEAVLLIHGFGANTKHPADRLDQGQQLRCSQGITPSTAPN